MTTELIEAYKNGDLILFVGAGVSRALGLPSWNELISQIGEKMGYDRDVFHSYGDALALAEYYKLKNGSIGPLRSWMDREWHHDGINILDFPVFNAISRGNYPIVYTTNYDRWLEKSYEANDQAFRKIISVNDLVGLPPAMRQIIKYHGDFDDDNSIVLSESSYYDRLQFETPLDIKLRADVLGKSVLFIGYSLTDINVRLLFYKLTQMWKLYGHSMARPKSYLFATHPNPIQETVLGERGIHVITSDIPDPGKGLEKFMETLNESLS